MSTINQNVPIIMLCGGKGIRLLNSNVTIPKGLVQIGGKTLFEHVLDQYVRFGFYKFILSCGIDVEKFRGKSKSYQNENPSVEISIVDSGENASTGDRINKCRYLIDGFNVLGVSYSDTLCDVNLEILLKEHEKKGTTANLLAAKLPTRFRILGMRMGEDNIRGFADRPVIVNDWINGGFYFFKKEIFNEKLEDSVLENEILEKIARDGQLTAYKHNGLWQHLDADRDIPRLEKMADLMNKPS